jgi:hypothetical protein
MSASCQTAALSTDKRLFVMRIGGSPGNALPAAYLWLTSAEAAELREALSDLLATETTDWHAHISSADYQTELTIARDSS